MTLQPIAFAGMLLALPPLLTGQGPVPMERVSLGHLRAVAGEAHTMSWTGRSGITSISSVTISPTLEFPFRPSLNEGRLSVVIPPATPPGDYSVTFRVGTQEGMALSAQLALTVNAVTIERSPNGRNPVILLNGFQAVCFTTASTITASMDTFGQLANLLQQDGVPVTFFNNCSYGDISIESLGQNLASYLSNLRYSDGVTVSRVDLVAHSMGGLIVRSYLSGKGTASGSFSPPLNTPVQKFVTIGTPHFGSFQAGDVGVQESEMVVGSQVLWDLATWNQGQDDLRGVDALAVIGNAGTYRSINYASDGVVSLTSASLNFTRPDQRTRIVPYCHTSPSGLGGLGMSCANAKGIASVDNETHMTSRIVRSFLANTSDWQTIGATPSQDPFLKSMGGAFVALEGINGAYYQDLTCVQFDNGSCQLTRGPSSATASIYYAEFAPAGSHAFVMKHSTGEQTTGTGTISVGGSSALLFKFSPHITSVQSGHSTGFPGLTVGSGTTISASGVGFRPAGQPTGLFYSVAPYASYTPLVITSLTDTQITSSLPSGLSGLVKLVVTTGKDSSGNVQQDFINIMAAPAAQPPTISLSTPSLQFALPEGSPAPGLQQVQISNSAGGALNWTATSNAPWLTVSPSSGAAPSTLNIVATATTLPTGSYNGTITISASGAVSQNVAVTLTVTPSAKPRVVASVQQISFSYQSGAAPPPVQTFSVSNSGASLPFSVASSGGTWLSVTPTSGTTTGTVTVQITPTGLAPGNYAGQVVLTSSGASNSPLSIPVSLGVTAPQSAVSITSVVNGATFSPGFASSTWVTITGSNLSQTTRTWRGDEIVNGLLPTSLDGVNVKINGFPTYVYYISPNQLNVLAPSDNSTGTADKLVPVVVTSPAGSATFQALKRQVAPGMFMLDGKHVAAVNTDGSLVTVEGSFSGTQSHPARPGDYVSLYATGLGPTNPPIQAGQIPTSLGVLVNPATVIIGGVNAPVLFAGLVSPGLYQINLQIPDVPDGDQPISIQVLGVSGQDNGALAVRR